MIRGFVNTRREAIVRLRLRGPNGVGVDVDAVVDTGCTASLTLPTATAAALGLVLHSTGKALLADGSAHRLDVFSAEVLWGGSWQPVLVSAVGAEVLLGMRLLAGHQLRIDVVPGGLVEILSLP